MNLIAVKPCLVALAIFCLTGAVVSSSGQTIGGKTQKPSLTDTSYKSWTDVNRGKLSGDGKYTLFRINNYPLGKNTWFITATNKSWKMTSTTIDDLNFSDDSKFLFFREQNDTLSILNLKTKGIEKISKCKNYQLKNDKGGQWLIYQLRDSFNTLIVRNLKTRKEVTTRNVKQYVLNPQLATLLVKSSDGANESIRWMDISTGDTKLVHHGKVSSSIIFDLTGHQIAFATVENNQTSIWYYSTNEKKEILIANDQSRGISKELKISINDFWRFSKDGESIFLNLKKSNWEDPDRKDALLIWNYQDAFLASEKVARGENALHDGENLSILNIKSKTIRQLLSEHQKPISGSFDCSNDDIIGIESRFGSVEELPWNKSAISSYSLCFTKTGVIRPLSIEAKQYVGNMALSQNNDYLIYQLPESKRYYSYNIKFDRTSEIKSIPEEELKQAKVLTWIENESKVIIRSKYDLWLLDQNHLGSPINLTKEIGNKKQITFLYSKLNGLQSVKSQDNLLINGFDDVSKMSYFYMLNISKHIFREIYHTQEKANNAYTNDPAVFTHTKDFKHFLVKFERANYSPNYVFTSDFKRFDTLSNVCPERNSNWLTSELFTFKNSSGQSFRGIIYKPENFDPKLKYPVIFTYYQKVSDLLNKYIEPEPTGTGINIPVMVSNGYIVVRPDLQFSEGKPGESALDILNSAANVICQNAWADSSKLGIIGHSLGGYLTEYFISHSNRFAAAVACAGISNWIDFYNESWATGNSKQGYVKNAGAMKYGLEINTKDYIINTPILYTKNIHTPLLMMHNDEDVNALSYHSKKMFIQLRSERKPVWLLQYAGESHQLSDENNQIDLQKKIRDFFDAFLKGEPLPEWLETHI